MFFGYFGQIFSSFQTDCQTSCDVGKITVATDSFACRSGTYSFYCCDDPNPPSDPPLPTISLCPGPQNPAAMNTELDPEANLPNVYIEVTQFDSDCSLPTYSSTSKRDEEYQWAARPHLQPLFQNDSFMISSPQDETLGQVRQLEHPRGSPTLQVRRLQPRGVREQVAMALCGPSAGQKSSLYPQNYPGAPTILRTTGKAFTVAKKGVCAALGVTALTTLDSSVSWVAEHVFEKQEFRDGIEWMAAGMAPDGTVLTAGAVPWTGVFDNTGVSSITNLGFALRQLTGELLDFPGPLAHHNLPVSHLCP